MPPSLSLPGAHVKSEREQASRTAGEQALAHQHSLHDRREPRLHEHNVRGALRRRRRAVHGQAHVCAAECRRVVHTVAL